MDGRIGRAKKRQGDAGSYLIIAFAVIWLTLIAVFFSYFVILNSSLFILYSFIGFVVLGVLLAIDQRFVVDATIISLVLIVSSSLSYMGLLHSYFLECALIGVVSISIISSPLIKLASRYKVYLVLFFLLLIPLSLVPGSAPFVSINVAIAGYYMLIVAFIALFLDNIDAGAHFHRTKLWLNSVMNRAWHNSVAIGVLALIGFVLLVLPIWPSYPHANLNAMPYADMMINSNSTYINSSILIELNLSYYSDFVNQNFSNLRFAYGGREVPTLALPSKNNNYDRYFLLEPNIQIENKLTLYFLPNSSGFGRYLKPNNTVSSLHAFTVSLQGPHNVRDYIHVNTTYYAPVRFSKSIEFNETAYPPYQLMPTICNSGYNQSTTIDIRSNNTSSFFVFLNDTSFSKAVLADVTPTYAYYVNRFANYSSVRFLNSTRGKLNLSYNQLCIYLAVVPEKNTRLNIRLNSSYYASKLFTETIIEPVIPRAYISYGFVTEGVEYLTLKYENETLGTQLR